MSYVTSRLIAFHKILLLFDRVLTAMGALHDEKWGDGMQQDAQEFMHGLLNQLQVMTCRCK
jgi:hypothetical protein